MHVDKAMWGVDMRRYAHLERIRMLDPQRDCHEIYRTTALYEFPWDLGLALNLAFYRTFAVPEISTLLESTGEMTLRTRKRTDDTGILLFEMVDHGFDHPRGRAAVRRLNQIHRAFDIANEDYLYVLATFVVVPIRWLDRYGWRSPCCHERAATSEFYRQLGRRMNLADLPDSFSGFERFLDRYERERFRYAEPNARLMRATRDMLVRRFPAALVPAAGTLVDALFDEPLRRAVGAAGPPRPARTAVHLGFLARARVERLLPPRRRAAFAGGIMTPTYPDGYTIAEIGPT